MRGRCDGHGHLVMWYTLISVKIFFFLEGIFLASVLESTLSTLSERLVLCFFNETVGIEKTNGNTSEVFVLAAWVSLSVYF